MKSLLRMLYGRPIVIEGTSPTGRYDVLIKVPEAQKEKLMPRVQKCIEEAFGLVKRSETRNGIEHIIVRFPD